MTEEQWRSAGDPHRMLNFACRRNERKARLFACACCRRLWGLIVQERHREAVEVGERFADREAGHAERLAALRGAESRTGTGSVASQACVDRDPFAGARYGSHAAALFAPPGEHPHQQSARQADLRRDLFGNPFRPVCFDPSWRTDTALALARQMYASREFSAMPIRADALQDAGCADEDVLGHCRGEGPHVRGCWACDLVLGNV
jgi:hypothetical protein